MNIKFSQKELLVILACLEMTGGNEINEHILTAKLKEEATYQLYLSASKKVRTAILKIQSS